MKKRLPTKAIDGVFIALCKTGDFPSVKFHEEREGRTVDDSKLKSWTEIVGKDMALPQDGVGLKIVSFDNERVSLALGIFRLNVHLTIAVGVYTSIENHYRLRLGIAWMNRWFQSMSNELLEDIQQLEPLVRQYALTLDMWLEAKCTMPTSLKESIFEETHGKATNSEDDVFYHILSAVMQYRTAVLISNDAVALQKYLNTLVLFLPDHRRLVSSTEMVPYPSPSYYIPGCSLYGISGTAPSETIIPGSSSEKDEAKSVIGIIRSELESQVNSRLENEGEMCVVVVEDGAFSAYTLEKLISGVLQREAQVHTKPCALVLDIWERLNETKLQWHIIRAIIENWRRQVFFTATMTYELLERGFGNHSAEEISMQKVVCSILCDVDPSVIEIKKEAISRNMQDFNAF